MPLPLPRSLVPLPGEALTGLLLRLSHRLDQSPGEIARRTGLCRRPHQIPASLMLTLEREQLASFTAAARLSSEQVAGLMLRALARHYPPVAQMRPRGAFPPGVIGTGHRYCPGCLAGDGSEIQNRHGGPWQSHWRLAIVFACREHECFLQEQCPGCRQPLLSRGLLPAPTTAGLHPAQCRNQSPGQGTLCGNRLDEPDQPAPDAAPGAKVLQLQQRLIDLLHPTQPPEHSYTTFADLQFISTVVCATWPAAATITADPILTNALDDHIVRRRDPDRLTNIERSNRWTTPPGSPRAAAALLDISARLLSLPGQGLGHALTALLEHAEPPATQGWGKTWSLLRSDCSASTKAQLKAALPSHFPGRTAALSARRRALPQRIPLSHRDRDIRPEHVPQWLPDDWFAAMGTTPSAQSMRQNHIFRRFAAIQLVMDTAGLSEEDAINYLGIPIGWQQGPAHRRKLLPLHSFKTKPDLATAFDQLSRHVAQIDKPVNYCNRRVVFANWVLPAHAWGPIAQQVNEHGPHARFRLHTQLQDAASSFVWAQVTGSEPSLAFSARGYWPITEDPLSKRFRLSLYKIRKPGEAMRYQALNRLTTEYARILASEADARCHSVAN